MPLRIWRGAALIGRRIAIGLQGVVLGADDTGGILPACIPVGNQRTGDLALVAAEIDDRAIGIFGRVFFRDDGGPKLLQALLHLDLALLDHIVDVDRFAKKKDER